MDFRERELRDLLFSPYGENCGHALVDALTRGGSIVVMMDDGEVHNLREAEKALKVLREVFHWTPSEPQNP